MATNKPTARTDSKQPAVLLGWMVSLIGIAVLFGWAFDVQLLKTATPSITHTLANSAIAFVFAGSSLALTASNRMPRLAQALAVAVTVIAIVTLIEHIFSWNIGIDQLLVHDDAVASTDAPGRMRLVTTICFVLIGLSLTALCRDARRPYLFQAEPAFVAGVGLLTITGYAYGVTDASATKLTTWFTPMGLYTAITFMLLSVGVFLARPDVGVVARLRSPGPGGAILRRLLVPVILLPIFGGIVRLRLQQANFFDSEYGTALFTTFVVAAFVGAVWLTARSLDQIAAERSEVLSRERAIFNSALDGLISIDSEGSVLDFNPVAEEMFGFKRADMIGQDMAELLIPERLRAAHRAGLTRLRGSPETTSKTRLETIAIRADGSEFDVEISIGQPGKNATAAFVGNIRDISKRKSLEQQLRQAQKLEAIGQLAGGVAHDFNNLLTVIMGYVTIAQEKTGSGPAAEDLEEVSRSTMRAVDLTSQLLAFSRQQVLRTESLDIGDVVVGVKPMLERLIGEDIEVVVFREPVGLVLADRGQIEQVVVNLAVNARDAMPKGGRILIETRNVAIDENYSSVNAELAPGAYVCLSITDNGTGISAATAEHIFEPFFTTKGVGKGTGLGLSTVHGIVTQSGGGVTLYSEPGLGTSFKVYLPVTTSPAKEPTDDAGGGPAEKARGNETILLCEDEETVRVLIDRILSKAGYDVISADGPLAAIHFAESREGDIDMLVSDVIMPGMSGVELADHLTLSGRHLPTLLLSGYSAGTIEDRTKLPVGSDFLEKPFRSAELLDRVRAMLDAERGAASVDAEAQRPPTP
jgi:PAS domain S-box-containing protein